MLDDFGRQSSDVMLLLLQLKPEQEDVSLKDGVDRDDVGEGHMRSVKRMCLEVEFGCGRLIPSRAPLLLVEASVDVEILLIVSHPLGDDWGALGSLVLNGYIILDELHQ